MLRRAKRYIWVITSIGLITFVGILLSADPDISDNSVKVVFWVALGISFMGSISLILIGIRHIKQKDVFDDFNP